MPFEGVSLSLSLGPVKGALAAAESKEAATLDAKLAEARALLHGLGDELGVSLLKSQVG